MNRDSSHTKRDLIFDNSYLLETVLQKETDLQHGLKIEYEYMKSKYENNI
jgi:UDP-glucose 4-epimerase